MDNPKIRWLIIVIAAIIGIVIVEFTHDGFVTSNPLLALITFVGIILAAYIGIKIRNK